LALGNSSLKTFSRPGKPSIMPNTTLLPLKPLFLDL
jgi:hypothetical protein